MFTLQINGQVLEAVNLTANEINTLRDVKARVEAYQKENPDWNVNPELKAYLNNRQVEEKARIAELNNIRQSFK